MKKNTPTPFETAEAVACAAVGTLLDGNNISLIVVLTDSGKLARLVCKYRPGVPVLACSVNASVVRNMNTVRSAIGLKIPTF